MVFEEASHLRDCLEMILKDSTVIVERIKNRYTDDYDMKISAGYRYVCIYVCMYVCHVCMYVYVCICMNVCACIQRLLLSVL